MNPLSPWMQRFGNIVNSVLNLSVTTNADPHHPPPITMEGSREGEHPGSLEGKSGDGHALLADQHQEDADHHEDDHDHDHDEDDWHHHG